MWRINETDFYFRVFEDQFVGVDVDANVVAKSKTPGALETFQILRNSGDPKRVRIKASNGFFLQVFFFFLINLHQCGLPS